MSNAEWRIGGPHESKIGQLRSMNLGAMHESQLGPGRSLGFDRGQSNHTDALDPLVNYLLAPAIFIFERFIANLLSPSNCIMVGPALLKSSNFTF